MRKIRKRYVAFRVVSDNDAERRDIISAINRKYFSGWEGKIECPWLTVFEGNQGIVRCRHTDKDGTIELLRSIEDIGNKNVRIETIKTSGTMRKLKKMMYG